MSDYTIEQAQAAGWVFKSTAQGDVEAVKQYSREGASATELLVRGLTADGVLAHIEQRELQLGGASSGAPLQTVIYPGDVRISDAQHVALQEQNLQPVNGDLPQGVAAVVEAGAVAEGQVTVEDPSVAPATEPDSGPSSDPTSPAEAPSPGPISSDTPETPSEPVVTEPNIEDALPAGDAVPDPAVPVDSTPAE